MIRLSKQLARLALPAVVALVWLAAPAGAIETASFGLNPGGQPGRTALHEDVKPGQRVDDTVRLWNKTDVPVVVRLQVQGAAIDGGGQVSLGGNGGAAQWVSIENERITLPPKASIEVPVSVKAPREMPKGESLAAIVAEAEAAPGTASVSVVQRVALMVYAKAPAGSPLKAALGWVAWVAVALLAAVAVAVYTMRGRKRTANDVLGTDSPKYRTERSQNGDGPSVVAAGHVFR